jgi:hypothetical protein
MLNPIRIAACAAFAMAAHAQTVSITGSLYSVSGEPIAGATCQFKNAANKAVTDANGKFDFARSPVALRPASGYSLSLASQGGQLILKLDHPARVSLDLFTLAGRKAASLADEAMPAGTRALALIPPQGARQLFLLRARLDGEEAWHKLSLREGASVLSAGEAPAYALRKSAATDSLFCTEPNHHGGLAHINGTSVPAYTGTYALRMFSSDPAWKAQCGMPVTFNFDNSAGVARYKQLIPDWVATEQEVLMEVCQATFKKATQPRKYASYVANIRNGDGVAATGGNNLEFNASYIASQPNSYAGWYEVVGVQVHEAVHSYQAYYNTTGASGFGEAMPDAVRALTGFFRWPRGTKCTGSYTDVYQTGGKYWYFIEMKHPGFLTGVWQMPSGDIAQRVQTLTGESLSSMVSECQTKGMP